MAKYYYSPTKQKVLLLVAAGAGLILARSSKMQWRIMRNLPKMWERIDRRILRRILREFTRDRLVDFQEHSDDTISVVLTEKGNRFAMRYNPEKLVIKTPSRWDKKWRVVTFDIPEKKKPAREALRKQLQELDFYQIQKSVWVHPYECGNEIDFISELFEVRNFVHYLIVESIRNDAALKLHFNLV